MRISLGVRGQGGRDDDDDDDDGVEQASSFDDLCVESVMNRCDKREYSEGREGGREHTKKKRIAYGISFSALAFPKQISRTRFKLSLTLARLPSQRSPDAVGPSMSGGQMVCRVKLGLSVARKFHAACSACFLEKRYPQSTSANAWSRVIGFQSASV